MMPRTAPAKPAAPPIEEQENKLYADLDATNVVTLPPDQRVKKLIEMQPAEFRDFLQHLSRPDRVALFADLSPEQKETVFALINPQLVVGGELLVTRVLRDIYSERQLEAVMTDFWLNHFNVYLKKGEFAPWYLADYQNKVIRPHAHGQVRGPAGGDGAESGHAVLSGSDGERGAAFAGGVAVADGAERAGGQSADGGAE